MIKIGITGGIGSGKSTVAQLFSLLGVPVYIADDESKRLTATSPTIRQQLTALFGNDLYTEEGLNKKRLASLIFGNPQHLQKVNAIIHPEVKHDFLAWTNRQSTPLCAIESAILFETNFERTVDCTLMVYAPLDVRISRVCQRDGSLPQEIERRIQSQMDDEVKRAHADYVIQNDGQQALIPQVVDFLQKKTIYSQLYETSAKLRP